MIPENQREALNMNLKPCDYCNMGWGCYSKNESKSCNDTCEYYKEYYENTIMPEARKMVKEIFENYE